MSTTHPVADASAAAERDAAIAGFRVLADYLGNHPEVPVPDLGRNSVIVTTTEATLAWLDGMDDIVLTDALGPESDYAYVRRDFAGLTMSGMVRRAAVCPDGLADIDTIRERLTAPALALGEDEPGA